MDDQVDAIQGVIDESNRIIDDLRQTINRQALDIGRKNAALTSIIGGLKWAKSTEDVRKLIEIAEEVLKG